MKYAMSDFKSINKNNLKFLKNELIDFLHLKQFDCVTLETIIIEEIIKYSVSEISDKIDKFDDKNDLVRLQINIIEKGA